MRTSEPKGQIKAILNTRMMEHLEMSGQSHMQIDTPDGKVCIHVDALGKTSVDVQTCATREIGIYPKTSQNIQLRIKPL